MPVLKFLQKLAFDFPSICLLFFLGLSPPQMYRNLKSGSRSSGACNTLNFCSVDFLGVKL